MAAFYGKKILNHVINPKTDQPWTIEDVPTHWRSATEVWLQQHGN